MLDGIRRRMKVQSEHPILTMSAKLTLILFAIPIGGFLGIVRYCQLREMIREETSSLETEFSSLELAKLEAVEPVTM